MVGQNILGREFKFFPPGNLGIAIFCQTKQENDFDLKHFTFNRRAGVGQRTGWWKLFSSHTSSFTRSSWSWSPYHHDLLTMISSCKAQRGAPSPRFGGKTMFWSCCGSSAKFCVWVICKDNFKRFILSQDEDTFSVQSFYNMILQTYWCWGTHCI